MLPVCKGCSGTGKKWRGPSKIDCPDCEGTGRRPAKTVQRFLAPPKLGKRKRSKMLQVAEHKMNYLVLVAEREGRKLFVNGEQVAPCQTCEKYLQINSADFSHKKAAGMGGAGDQNGLVSAKNGTYSCRCCHAFIEQDLEAKKEHEACEANIENGLKVEFSQAVRERLEQWTKKYQWIG